jgi:hypothetical protein
MFKSIKCMLVYVAVTLFTFSAGNAARLHNAPSADYTLHTLYIFNFAKYIEWPGSSKAIKIGVVNSSQAEEALQKMAKAKSTSAAPIIVTNTKSETELEDCQIIFIPSNSSQLTARLIERFSALPILIVTEDADMIRKGAGVSFKVATDKLRFQINEETLKAKGLKVASSLVTLSEK